MKKICLKLVSILCIAITMSITSTAFAMTSKEITSPNAAHRIEQIMPLSEETVWITRNNNGRQQKRLWSLTKGYWLTDWIDC